MTTRPTAKRTSLLHRMVRAAALRADAYEEVEADPAATVQAVGVVVLASVAAGVGARGFGGGAPGDIAFFTVVALCVWGSWALLTYQLGARILPERTTQADVGQLLRTLGFAASPGVAHVVGVLPGMTRPVFAVTSIWMLLAMIVAVRQALDYESTGRAVAVCVVGWLLAMALAVAAGTFFGPVVS